MGCSSPPNTKESIQEKISKLRQLKNSVSSSIEINKSKIQKIEEEIQRLDTAIKVGEQIKILKYYAKQGHKDEMQVLMEAIGMYRKKIISGKDRDALRGMEGIASRTYFEGFRYILDQEKWPWIGRSRRPAQDAVNALLNYGYAFLEREVRLGIIGSGLDVRIGFLHSNNGRKDSLVLSGRNRTLHRSLRLMFLSHFKNSVKKEVLA